jgi:hypothetical protein
MLTNKKKTRGETVHVRTPFPMLNNLNHPS